MSTHGPSTQHSPKAPAQHDADQQADLRQQEQQASRNAEKANHQQSRPDRANQQPGETGHRQRG